MLIMEAGRDRLILEDWPREEFGAGLGIVAVSVLLGAYGVYRGVFASPAGWLLLALPLLALAGLALATRVTDVTFDRETGTVTVDRRWLHRRARESRAFGRVEGVGLERGRRWPARTWQPVLTLEGGERWPLLADCRLDRPEAEVAAAAIADWLGIAPSLGDAAAGRREA